MLQMSIDVSIAQSQAQSSSHKVEIQNAHKVDLQALGAHRLHGRHKVAILVYERSLMPWQAQLFIGQRVHDNHEAREVFQKLGWHVLEYLNDAELEDALWEDPGFKWTIMHKGVSKEVEIFFRREMEGGCDWPVPLLTKENRTADLNRSSSSHMKSVKF
jgi:hypothetical protein